MTEPSATSCPVLALVTGLPGSGKSTVAGDAADLLNASLLSHDWAMSGLRPYPAVQAALDGMTPPGHGPVGWSVLGTLARAELRRGRSVVLDGVARMAEIERCHQSARAEGSRLVVILVECPDLDIHRSRIETRRRDIPGWYELTWDDVQRSRSRWSPPPHSDLHIDSTATRDSIRERIGSLLGSD